eukprot:PhF_6_TR44471/c0_g1_i2/m.68465
MIVYTYVVVVPCSEVQCRREQRTTTTITILLSVTTRETGEKGMSWWQLNQRGIKYKNKRKKEKNRRIVCSSLTHNKEVGKKKKWSLRWKPLLNPLTLQSLDWKKSYHP